MRGDASRQDRFRTIEHSPAALLREAIGGTACRNFYAHRDERRREAAEEEVGVMRKVPEAGLRGRGPGMPAFRTGSAPRIPRFPA